MLPRFYYVRRLLSTMFTVIVTLSFVGDGRLGVIWIELESRVKVCFPVLSCKIAEAKKRKSYRRSKKTRKVARKVRSKKNRGKRKTASKRLKKRPRKTRLKKKAKRKRSRATGVKSLWRKDGRNNSSRKRWQNTRSRVKQRLRRQTPKRGKSRYHKYRRRSLFRYRRRPLGTTKSSSTVNYASSNPSQSSVEASEYLNPNAEPKKQMELAEIASNPDRYNPSMIPLSSGSWIDVIELELSSTMWDFNSPLLRSDSDDWSAAKTEALYQISQQTMYRGQLRLYSQFIDLDINYESKAGLSFLSDQGTWLDLAFAVPNLIPALAPLSLSYRRVRFANGQVALLSEPNDLIEQQRFEMFVDRYEARWLLQESVEQSRRRPTQIALVFAYDQRALPRHIYLEERLRLNEEDSYSIYYDISDQLLWTPINSYDLGAELKAGLTRHLQITIAASIGLGAYELLTPLEGELLDQGSLVLLGFKAGLNYEVPLASFLSLKASYQVRGRAYSPTGLPDQLEQELSEELQDLDGVHLSFASIDLLHRVGLSLVFRLAER